MVSALFKAAEVGDLDKVREVLKECSSVDVEIKDHTGATPLIVAVKNGHVEVVEELLAAGADPLNPSSQGPPSSYTTVPPILSLLQGATPPHLQQPYYPPYEMYPPPPPMDMGAGGFQGYYPQMYMPPYGNMPYMQQHQLPPPQHQQQQQQQQQQAPTQDGEQKEDGTPVAQGEGNGTIPPPDVSKMIPCKFYPDCRYGSQCAFQHPAQPAFVPPPPPQMFPAYEPGPPFAPPFYHMAPHPFYNAGPPMRPPMHAMSAPPQGYPFQRPQPPHLSDYSNENAFIVVPPPFQTAPTFSPSATTFSPSVHAPSFAPPAAVSASASPQEDSSSSSAAPAATGASASEVPTASSAAGPNDPAIVAIASAPTNATSEQQQQAPVTSKAPLPFQQRDFTNGHGAGPFAAGRGGFRGGFKKFQGAPHAFKGQKWQGGVAPPCMYFQKAMCRNGDLCRFPHVGPDGVDSRLPGVIDGSVPAAPISMHKPDAVRRSFPLTLESQLPAELRGVSASAPAAAATTSADAPAQAESSTVSLPAQPGAAAAAARPFSASAATPAFVPAQRSASTANPAFVVQPQNRLAASALQQQPQQARSQPPTRSTSPNVPAGALAAQRSVSNGPAQRNGVAAAHKQRVPSSDDFPALGSSTGSLRESGVLVAAVGPAPGVRSAAQVLSGPAPPVVPKAAPAAKKAAAPAAAAAESSESGSSEHSEDDAVLVEAAKSAPSAPNGGTANASPKTKAAPLAVKKGPVVSFANAAGAVVGGARA